MQATDTSNVTGRDEREEKEKHSHKQASASIACLHLGEIESDLI
jgi:hypothetical protein